MADNNTTQTQTISIPAFREEGDHVQPIHFIPIKISIPAFREEGDLLPPAAEVFFLYFNPRLP